MSLEVNMNNQAKRPNPKYPLEFKQDAAKLVNEKGYTHQQAADHLGISLSAIGCWVRAERMPKATSKPHGCVQATPPTHRSGKDGVA
jgi:transposase-like protein